MSRLVSAGLNSAGLALDGLVSAGIAASQRLVLLSGWGVDKRIWQLLAPHWPTSLEVSSVDWPGYGKSPPLPGQASLGTLANTMSNLLPSDAIWVGWSLGGLLATALLDQLPAPQGLILIGAGERFCSDDGVSSTELASFRRAFNRDPYATWQHFLRWQAQGEPNSRRIHQQLRELLGDAPSANLRTLEQGLEWLSALDNHPRLLNAPCPVVRLAGEHDPLIGDSARSKAIQLPHSGHCPMLSQPALMATIIAEQATTIGQQAVQETL